MSQHIIPVESDVTVGWCPVCHKALRAHVTADVHVIDMKYSTEHPAPSRSDVSVRIEPQFAIEDKHVIVNHTCEETSDE